MAYAASHPAPALPDGALFFLGLLFAPIVPGIFIVLMLTGDIPAAVVLGALGGMVVGYPFAFLVFAPTVFVLAKHWRLTWWSLALAGFFSVLLVGVAHCIAQGHLAQGLTMDLALAACSGGAGFFFWLVAGDFGGANRKA
ncbi:hypothetical protein [Methylocystis parvus]|uniref:Uncharacterized protein n=1 Tax=Methylocystis parvus TaxID=134 RepID=A0A6B8M5P3_9HYPH|nr:hypothetical protein [Methylocystis parvus]QGM97736.1 hypothetical protein F7D14_09815 [Methylocystis parvus]WBK01961.1 hypothetical protein MMG94_09770 [Methylocystis parvus OBBP]